VLITSLVSYFLFSTFRKAEQNQVWVGMAKETAHQLGTPISSLMAWTELLKSQGVEDSVIVEINKDLNRLETVTDRFSKIGSGGELTSRSVGPVVENVYSYLEKRVSKKLVITHDCSSSIVADINEPLLEWVIENLSKNGIDAMGGEGALHAQLSEDDNFVHLDISDTGKGINNTHFKTVFEPGFTTKQRGWGLGLSLVKRIVEEYHHGKVFVLKSELGKGTTFRVSLKRSK
jgi:signal transduction histidine kinase